MGTLETGNRSFFSAFSICMTVLLTKIKHQNDKKDQWRNTAKRIKSQTKAKRADNQQQEDKKKLTERTRKLATMQGENTEMSARKVPKIPQNVTY